MIDISVASEASLGSGKGNEPQASTMSSAFGSSFCGSLSELRKHSNAAFVAHHRKSPGQGDGFNEADLGGSPFNTNIFSGFTPLASSNKSIFSPVLAADMDAPPAIRATGSQRKGLGIITTFTKNNANHAAAGREALNFSGAEKAAHASSLAMDIPRPPGAERENLSGSGPGKSKAIPIRVLGGGDCTSNAGSPYGGYRASMSAAYRGKAWPKIPSNVQPLSPSFGSLMISGTPDSMWDARHESYAIDASLTAGLNTNMSFAPSTQQRGGGEEELVSSISDGASLFRTRRFSAFASGMFGDGNFSKPSQAMHSSFLSIHTDPTRGTDFGGESRTESGKKPFPETAEYLEPSLLADSFTDLPFSPTQTGMVFCHSDPFSKPLTESPTVNQHDCGLKLADLLADPDAPPFLMGRK